MLAVELHTSHQGCNKPLCTRETEVKAGPSYQHRTTSLEAHQKEIFLKFFWQKICARTFSWRKVAQGKGMIHRG